MGNEGHKTRWKVWKPCLGCVGMDMSGWRAAESMVWTFQDSSSWLYNEKELSLSTTQILTAASTKNFRHSKTSLSESLTFGSTHRDRTL